MTTYYRFDPATGELLGAVETNKTYPAEHRSLTAIAPPEAQEGFARCFHRTAQAWVYETEHSTERDSRTGERVPLTVYDTTTGAARTVSPVGGLPEGTTLDAPSSSNQTWDETASEWIDPPPTVDDVAVERDRRLALGFDYNFGDERGLHRIATTEADMKGWDEVTKWSNAAIALGNGSATIDVLTETGPCTVTALEWQSVLIAATAARQPLWAVSFYLQTLDPIPTDYADDSYWES